MTDWGALAHEAAAKHLDACQDAYWCEQGECGKEHADGDCESPAVGPYCACETCTIREVLHAAWPVIEQAIRSGDFDAPAVSINDVRSYLQGET